MRSLFSGGSARSARSARSAMAALTIAGSLFFLGGCGGNRPAGQSNLPAKVNLNPTTSISLVMGGNATFTASALNASNQNVSAPFTFQADAAGVLDFTPTGVGCSGNCTVVCAGKWNAPSYSVCTPETAGTVRVTASADGASSAPTFVFVHAPIDNIQISYVPPVNSPPPACPGQQIIPNSCAPSTIKYLAPQGCLSTNQTMTLQAKAFSQGTDITAQVGPFTWSQANSSVMKIAPITTSSDNTPTNQAAVTPNTPGFTSVYASASGVSSQPYYTETCPVQCIALEMTTPLSDQTSFATNKGTSETVSATAVDVQGCVVPKPPLTWTSSAPGAVVAGSATTGCTAGTTCALATKGPGAATVTASCTPPSCNAGFPQSVAGLTPADQPLPLVQTAPVFPVTSISGVVNGAATTTSVIATSLDCQHTLPADCTVSLYNVSTANNLAGSATQIPRPPNSLLFDLAGDRAYMGSDFGALEITTGNIGSASTSPFTALGTVTGKVLAVSVNGNVAIFSDTLHTPNQVYVVNAAGSSSSITPLNITGASAAAFSPDGLKAYIFGYDSGNNPKLYVYSSIQALQTISLPAQTTVNGFAFSSNGAFVYVASSLPSGTGNVAVYDVCDNSPAKDAPSGTVQSIPLPAAPAFLTALPDGMHVFAIDASGQNVDLLTSTTSPAVNSSATTPALCPQYVSHSLQRIPLSLGTLNLLNVLVTPQPGQLYMVASNLSSVLAFNYESGSIAGAIPLTGGVTPVAASMTVDGTLIYVAGSDGLLHHLSTISSVDMPSPISFPTSTNAFCTNGISVLSCNLNVAVVIP